MIDQFPIGWTRTNTRDAYLKLEVTHAPMLAAGVTAAMGRNLTMPASGMRMDWSPATERFIHDQIGAEEAQLSADQLRIWKCVAITPVKWALRPQGDLSGDFWVVAILGRSAIWYNDIEDGFDVSLYSSFGEIDQYSAHQFELRHIMQQIIERISD